MSGPLGNYVTTSDITCVFIFNYDGVLLGFDGFEVAVGIIVDLDFADDKQDRNTYRSRVGDMYLGSYYYIVYSRSLCKPMSRFSCVVRLLYI